MRELLEQASMLPLDRILVGTDFSPGAERAVRLAADLARGFGAVVLLLHVDDRARTAPPSAAEGALRDRARTELERARRALEANGVRVQSLLRPGDPAREVLRVASTQIASMIVLGSHGASARPALLLGSVADRVVRYAQAPVLVVPPAARTPGAIPNARAGGGEGAL